MGVFSLKKVEIILCVAYNLPFRVALLWIKANACLGKCRSYGAQFAFICAYPGFHIGLCPHFTLGYAGVPPLQGSFSF